MPASLYLVDNLVTSLKNRGLPPTSQATFSLNQFIQILSEEMLTNIVPLIDSVSEEYFVTNYDQSYVTGQAVYSIPPRAVGGKLRDVVFVDASGLEIPLPRLRPEQIKQSGVYGGYQPNLWGFYLRNNQVVLYLSQATPTTAYPTLRMKYVRRPNILTAAANAGQILSINTGTREVTLDNAGSGWTASSTFDVIEANPQFSTVAEDQTVTNVAGFVLTFTTLPTGIAVGNYVALSNYSPIPQIPVEAHLLLAQYGAAKVLEAMGDTAGMKTAITKANDMKEQFLGIITPRVEGSVIKIGSSGGGIDGAMNNGDF